MCMCMCVPNRWTISRGKGRGRDTPLCKRWSPPPPSSHKKTMRRKHTTRHTHTHSREPPPPPTCTYTLYRHTCMHAQPPTCTPFNLSQLLLCTRRASDINSRGLHTPHPLRGRQAAATSAACVQIQERGDRKGENYDHTKPAHSSCMQPTCTCPPGEQGRSPEYNNNKNMIILP